MFAYLIESNKNTIRSLNLLPFGDSQTTQHAPSSIALARCTLIPFYVQCFIIMKIDGFSFGIVDANNSHNHEVSVCIAIGLLGGTVLFTREFIALILPFSEW